MKAICLFFSCSSSYSCFVCHLGVMSKSQKVLRASLLSALSMFTYSYVVNFQRQPRRDNSTTYPSSNNIRNEMRANPTICFFRLAHILDTHCFDFGLDVRVRLSCGCVFCELMCVRTLRIWMNTFLSSVYVFDTLWQSLFSACNTNTGWRCLDVAQFAEKEINSKVFVPKNIPHLIANLKLHVTFLENGWILFTNVIVKCYLLSAYFSSFYERMFLRWQVLPDWSNRFMNKAFHFQLECFRFLLCTSEN